MNRIPPSALALLVVASACTHVPARPTAAEGSTSSSDSGALTDGRAAPWPNIDGGIAFIEAAAPSLRIHDVQGVAHRSRFEGTTVECVPGVVTALGPTGFYMQDPEPDADLRTSEALFVFLGRPPPVAIGDAVLVTGLASEYRPGCQRCSRNSSAYANLTRTEIEQPSRVDVLAKGVALPAPVEIGPNGRRAPERVFEASAPVDVEDAGAPLDPDTRALDFYESLESMRVEASSTVVVGPAGVRGNDKQLVVMPSPGSGTRTARGGLLLTAASSNPERLLLTSALGLDLPAANVGDRFVGAVRGIVEYGAGTFELAVTDPMPQIASAELTREAGAWPPLEAAELSVATLNVENLDALDPDAKFAELAAIVAQNLSSPDLLALEEVQDDDGARDDGVVSAARTLSRLCGAIVAAGGVRYQAVSIDPLDGQDGGEPGGNIRLVFLLRTDRGLQLDAHPGADATTANAIVGAGKDVALAYSPGRVSPNDAAFQNSRKSLAARFTFDGRPLIVIANHFTSKTKDGPLFGRFQPPEKPSSAQRRAQARAVASFVKSILARNALANVLVLGDLNDFEFSETVGELEAASLEPLIERLPENERYTYVFQGNSQAIDHMLASAALATSLRGLDVVHVNAEFPHQASDHDPVIARIRMSLQLTSAEHRF